MAALLVAMAVMAILMGAALPVWRHEAQREKEEELVFRGQQYIRALRLYQSRTQTLPNSLDLLVNGHFLRKKYKDPVTGQDFELIGAGGVPGQAPGGVQGAPPGTQGGRASQPPQSQPQQASGFGGSSVSGGIMGVRSKSKEESIRLYQGRNHYNEWNFLYVQQQPGRGGPQRGGPPQRGGRGADGRPLPPGPGGGFGAGGGSGFGGGAGGGAGIPGSGPGRTGSPGGGFPGPGGAGPGRGPGGGPVQVPGGRRGGGGSL
jgi:type II secretory pathway pseudopilin PulG